MRWLGLCEDQERGAKLAAELDRLFSASLPRLHQEMASVRRRRGMQRRPLAGG